MEIEPGYLSQPFLPKRPEKKTKKTQTAAKTSFRKTLDALDETSEAAQLAQAAEQDTDLEVLLDEVHEAGHELLRYPGPENVQLYKEKIRRFIKMIVERSIVMTEVEGRLRKDMKRPKYALLQVIDEKLEQLGAYILSEQKEKLEILRRVDELYGLIVDLRQ